MIGRNQQTADSNTAASNDGQQLPPQQSYSSDDTSASTSMNADIQHFRIYWHPESHGGFDAQQLVQLVRQIEERGCSCTILINPKTITLPGNIHCLEQFRHLVVETGAMRHGSVLWSNLMSYYKVFATGRHVVKADYAKVVDYLYLADGSSPDASGIPSSTSRVLLLATNLPPFILDALRNLQQFDIRNPVSQMPVDLASPEEESPEVAAVKKRQVEKMMLASTVRHMSASGLGTTAVMELVMHISMQQINTRLTPLGSLIRHDEVDSDGDDETIVLDIPDRAARGVEQRASAPNTPPTHSAPQQNLTPMRIPVSDAAATSDSELDDDESPRNNRRA